MKKKNTITELPPMLVGVSKLAKLLGVSRQRTKEVLVALGVEPIDGIGAEGRPKYSYPQILDRLENINCAKISRRRAFRQPEMKHLFNAIAH